MKGALKCVAVPVVNVNARQGKNIGCSDGWPRPHGTCKIEAGRNDCRARVGVEPAIRISKTNDWPFGQGLAIISRLRASSPNSGSRG
jgi:hypothetical protein